MKTLSSFGALLSVAIALPVPLLGQAPPPIEWQRCLGGTDVDEARGLLINADSSITVIGQSFSHDGDISFNPNDPNWWMVRLAPDGTLEDEWTYGTDDLVGSCIMAYTAVPMGLNSCVVLGETSSGAGQILTYGGPDYLLVRFSETGQPYWVRAFGGSGAELPRALLKLTDGYLLCGSSESIDGMINQPHGGKDFWVARTDAQGFPMWDRNYGGSADDHADAAVITDDGGFALFGWTASTDDQVTGQHGESDFWLVKTGPTGALQWQRTYGGSDWDRGYDMHQTTDGGYIMAGESASEDGDVTGFEGWLNAWVVKANAQGDIEWQTCLGGTGDDMARAVRQTADGGYVLLCTTTSEDGDVTDFHGTFDMWLVRLDAGGGLLWQLALGGDNTELAEALEITPDGGYLLAGSAYSANGDVEAPHGVGDMWVLKFASDGGTTSVPGATAAIGDLRITPNPAHGQAWLTIPAMARQADVTVLDAHGRAVLRHRQGVPTDRLSLEGLAAGMYTVRACSMGACAYARLVVD